MPPSVVDPALHALHAEKMRLTEKMLFMVERCIELGKRKVQELDQDKEKEEALIRINEGFMARCRGVLQIPNMTKEQVQGLGAHYDKVLPAFATEIERLEQETTADAAAKKRCRVGGCA